MSESEEYREVPLVSLRLDPENPRLPRDVDWGSKPEHQFLKEFIQRYNLMELAQSITDKGFTPRHVEALLVVENRSEAGTYVVIEGNRRLATLKLLTDDQCRKGAGATGAEWEELAREAEKWNLSASVPVFIYSNRDVLNDYLGFRHITGPRPWRPEAKARFVARLLSGGESISDVRRRIGSNHRTVRRLAEAHAIYSQAINEDIPVDAVEAGFGVFYNALDRKGVRDFLGLGPQIAINELPDSPIPEDRKTELVQLIGLLYGDDSGLARVITESRELNKLDQVLANERARSNLLRDRNLDRAWRVSGGGRIDLLGQIDDIFLRLAEVSGQAPVYRDDPDVREGIARIFKVASDMSQNYHIEES